MYDTGKVLLGIVVFLALFTAPIWLNVASSQSSVRPDPKLPKGYTECVAEKNYMKAYHMDMLNNWRDLVVRQDIRYMDFQGGKMEMSLSKSCMKCHQSKVDFCDECHNYLDVNPYCWDCHVAPEEVK